MKAAINPIVLSKCFQRYATAGMTSKQAALATADFLHLSDLDSILNDNPPESVDDALALLNYLDERAEQIRRQIENIRQHLSSTASHQTGIEQTTPLNHL